MKRHAIRGAIALACLFASLAALAQSSGSTVTTNAAAVWRDWTVDGVPSSGAWNPRKLDIRQWGALVGGQLNSLQGAQVGGTLAFDTRANLDATLTYPANSMAFVFADGTSSNNGVYRKSGASGSGSWAKVSNLIYGPQPVFSVAGAFTTNPADAAVSISGPPVSPLISFTVPRGTLIHSTNGAPSNSLGVNGDFAIDPATYALYGPKAAGVWPAASATAQGAAAAAGASAANAAASAANAAASAATVAIPIDLYAQAGDQSDCEAVGRAVAANPGKTVRFPSRVVNLGTVSVACSISITAQITIEGAGWQETTSTGTVLNIPNTSSSPFVISGTSARGARFRKFAVKQTHPAPSGGSWSPTVYPPVFDMQNTLGEVAFENIHAFGIYDLLNSYNSGRLLVRGLRGQVYHNGITLDRALDVPRIFDVHFWPYVTSDSRVLAYQQSNLDAITLRRVDTPFLDDVFIFASRSGLKMEESVDGIPSKIKLGKIGCDFTRFCVDSDAPNVTMHIGSITAQSEDALNPGVPLSNGRAIRIGKGYTFFAVGTMEAERYAAEAIEFTSDAIGSHLRISILRCNLVNNLNVAGVGCAKNSGDPSNLISFDTYPIIINSFGATALSTGSGAITGMQQNTVGNRANYPVAYDAVSGGVVRYSVVGSDANIRNVLDSKGNERASLAANGKLIFSVDDFAGNGDTAALCRTGIGGLVCSLESGSTNASWDFSAKGTGTINLNSAVRATALPTSCAGLLTGALINNAGVVNVCP